MGDQSSMSEMSGIEASSVASSTEGGDQGNDSKKVMIVMALCLVVLLSGLVYFVLFAGSSGEPTGGGAGDGGDEASDASYSKTSSGSTSGPSSPSATTSAAGGTKLPPDAYVSKNPDDGSSRHPAAASITRPDPAAGPGPASKDKGGSDSAGKGRNTTPDRHQGKAPAATPKTITTTTSTLPPKIFACTYAELGVLNIMVPPDGVCDIIFYTDVFYEETTKSIMPQFSLTAYEVLLNKTHKYKSTTFGTSMALGNINESIARDKDNVIRALHALFNKGMVHFGMLNVYNLQDYDTLKNGDFTYFSVVQEFLTQKKTNSNKYLCALGAGINDGQATANYTDLVKRAVTDFPVITMMVMRVHTELVKTEEDRYTVGPNPDGMALSDYNMLTVDMIADLRNRLEAMILDRQFYAMLSFAMYARTFTMSPSWTLKTERTLAWNTTIMDYRLTCLMGTAVSDPKDPESSYAADVTNHFLAIFDVTQNIETKIRNRMTLNLPAQPVGIMAYHVEMDDFNNVCSEGAFSRTKKIREIMYATKPTKQAARGRELRLGPVD